MTKNTMGTKLPRKLVQKMSIVGEQIELARLRRNLSVAQIAERATCSLLTVSRIEKAHRQLQSEFICECCMPCSLTMIFCGWPKKTNWEKLCRI